MCSVAIQIFLLLLLHVSLGKWCLCICLTSLSSLRGEILNNGPLANTLLSMCEQTMERVVSAFFCDKRLMPHICFVLHMTG